MTIATRIFIVSTFIFNYISCSEAQFSASYFLEDISVFDMLTNSSDQVCYMESRVERYKNSSPIKTEVLNSDENFVQYAVSDKEAIICAWIDECAQARRKGIIGYY